HAEPAPGAAALAHLRARLGLRLQPLLKRARRLRRLPAAEDRGRGRGPPDPHRARHRLRHARAVSLRGRLTLVAAGVVAVVVVLASTSTYFLMRHELSTQLNGALRNEAHAMYNDPQSSLRGDFGGNLVYVVDSSGSYVNGSPGLRLQVDARVLA